VTAGGGSKSYNGSVDSSQPFSTVTPVSVEANDTLNYTTDPSRIVFGLTTTAPIRWIRFQLSGLCDVCFNVNLLPARRCMSVAHEQWWRLVQFGDLGACSTLLMWRR